jgi:hypothetical protein
LYKLALWTQLYQDPLYELRLLSLRSVQITDFTPGQSNLGEDLNDRVQNFTPSTVLTDKLRQANIIDVFDTARQEVMETIIYHEALQAAPEHPEELGPYRQAIARAIVATIIAQCYEKEHYTPIFYNAQLRDDLITQVSRELITNTLEGDYRSISEWTVKQVAGLAVALGAMDHMKRKRGVITDAAYPAAGDILFYLSRGEIIRTFICEQILAAEPPVVVIAHSLGGVASVDLLIQKNLPMVKLLVTVGSQSPFLYEIDALPSLHFGQSLPDQFPTWLNIYDENDFLSYIGEGVFPGRVTDVRVDNAQPFPWSHSAYWMNAATWDAIVLRIP